MLAALVVAMTAQTPMHELSDRYLKALYRDKPMTASQLGYHQNGVDRRLDSRSPASLKARAAWLASFAAELAKAQPREEEDRSDRRLLEDAVALERLELETAHDYARRCDLPLDDLGSALFAMVARPYASDEQRASDIAARLGEIPRFLDEVRGGLTTDVEVFRAAAKDDGEGLLDYLEHELAPAFDKTTHAPAVHAAVKTASEAVGKYLAFVEHELPKKPKASFRYGAALYARRFRPYLQTRQSPAEVLAAAEKRAAEIRVEMARLAKQLVPSGDVRQALAKLGEDHVEPAGLFAEVRHELDVARAFVAEKQLVGLPGRDNLTVIETPPFLRSQLGVAAFDGAPPLQPQLGAFYYVTPFPSSWPKEKVAAKLREYNRWMLSLITVHEAIPGHYVQFEWSNRVEPELRRVLRWVLGSGSYIEGWAVHAQEVMLEAGFLGGNPRLALAQLKLELRAVTNAILDIKLHTEELSDADALSLMIDGAYQERPEAEQKLLRAKLSVTQLCSYFVGGEAWRRVRRAAQSAARAQGRPFDGRALYDRLLALGPITLDELERR